MKSLGTGIAGDILLLLLIEAIERSWKFKSFRFIEEEGVGSPFIDSKSIAETLNRSSSSYSMTLLASLFSCVLRFENLFDTGK